MFYGSHTTSDYNQRHDGTLALTPRLKVLFVCGRNQWRSPTAERIYRNDPRMLVRSAGVSPQSERQVSERDLDWADLILVMERAQAVQIRQQFSGRAHWPVIKSLEIPDEYQFMDPELVGLIKEGTEDLIDSFLPDSGLTPGDSM